MTSKLKFVSLALALCAPSANALASFISDAMYISDWIPVNYTTEGNWPDSTKAAQQEIIAGAQWLGSQGPWCKSPVSLLAYRMLISTVYLAVVNKTILPPTGNIHDYYSLSPYWWPDCSKVDNTTELTDAQISQECVSPK
jgi:hypothetical protein